MDLFKLLVCIMLLPGYFLPGKNIDYCGRPYEEKPRKVYLVDERVEATMMQVINKKNGKPAFGYFIDAVRNDTNFIYSTLSFRNDTIIRKDHYRYGIRKGIDSSMAIYICTRHGIRFHTYTTYFNGAPKTMQKHDRITDQ